MSLLFGGLAIAVAGVGLSTILASKVVHRRHEIALRAALGAPRQHVLGRILRDGFVLIGVGLMIGLAMAVLASRWIEPLLVRSTGLDALVFGVVAAVLMLTGLVASAVPARRATQVDPARVLGTLP